MVTLEEAFSLLTCILIILDYLYNVLGSAQKLKVFLDYYGNLSTIALSFKNIASYFVSARIITTDDNQVIQNTKETPKIACLVLNKIKNLLEIGDKEIFDQFLNIMESHGDNVCVRLAKEIRLKLHPKTKEHESKWYPSMVALHV